MCRAAPPGVTPRQRFLVLASAAAAAFVLVGHPHAVPAADGVDFAEQAPGVAGHLDRPVFRRFIVQRHHVVMQPPAGVDSGVGDADLFDFLQVEQPFAVQEGV